MYNDLLFKVRLGEHWCLVFVLLKRNNQMFGLFKKDKKKELQKKYEKLMGESYKLSTTDRKASDLKRAEADAVADEIAKLA